MLHQRLFKSKNLRLKLKKFCFKINKELTVKILYRLFLNEKLNLDNPVSYNEKLQWIKLYYYDEMMVKAADKYLIREIVEERGHGDILNDLYGVYDRVEDIDFDSLPDKFVIKTNHACNTNIIVDSKADLDKEETIRILKEWLKIDYYWANLEWVYKGIEPKIIIERNLNQKNGKPPVDYKIFCFDGEPKVIGTIRDRETDITNNLYDSEWNFIDAYVHLPNRTDKHVEKPVLLKEMMQVARDLSKGFPQVRVDLYIDEDKIVFGELTFFNGSGFIKLKPDWFSEQMGDWLILPEKSYEKA